MTEPIAIRIEPHVAAKLVERLKHDGDVVLATFADGLEQAMPPPPTIEHLVAEELKILMEVSGMGPETTRRGDATATRLVVAERVVKMVIKHLEDT